MYSTVFIDHRVSLSPKEVAAVKTTDEINTLLENKIRNVFEGRCHQNGYIRPGSIKLIGKSVGIAENGRFTGNFLYNCKVSCEALYPTANMIITGRIIDKNKLGVYAVLEEAMQIILPRDLHDRNELEILENVMIGDEIDIRLMKSRFKINEAFIVSVGVLVPANKRKMKNLEEKLEEEEVELQPLPQAQSTKK
jgi:hypothetical protein